MTKCKNYFIIHIRAHKIFVILGSSNVSKSQSSETTNKCKGQGFHSLSIVFLQRVASEEYTFFKIIVSFSIKNGYSARYNGNRKEIFETSRRSKYYHFKGIMYIFTLNQFLFSIYFIKAYYGQFLVGFQPHLSTADLHSAKYKGSAIIIQEIPANRIHLRLQNCLRCLRF